MKNLSLLQWLLLFPALLLLLFCLAVVVVVLSIAPPVVSGVSLAVLGVVAVWFFFARRSGSAPSTEGALMGRQSSKEGLL